MSEHFYMLREFTKSFHGWTAFLSFPISLSNKRLVIIVSPLQNPFLPFLDFVYLEVLCSLLSSDVSASALPASSTLW